MWIIYALCVLVYLLGVGLSFGIVKSLNRNLLTIYKIPLYLGIVISLGSFVSILGVLFGIITIMLLHILYLGFLVMNDFIDVVKTKNSYHCLKYKE